MVTSVSASLSFHASRSAMVISTISLALNKRSTHMAQVDHRFVVTCLICVGNLQIFTTNLERAVCACEPSEWEFGGLTNPHTSVQSLGIPPRPHNGGAGRHKEPGVIERFFKGTVILLVGARFASPTCAIEVTRDKINVFLYYCSITQSAHFCTSWPPRCGSATTSL